MTLAAVAAYCDALDSSVRTRPFGPEPLVFKVGGRIFALLGQHRGHESVSLKCDPDRSLVLRTSYPAIVPGYHLNKEHWNTLVLDGTLPAALVRELIRHSHELVQNGLAKSKRSGHLRRPARRP